MEPTDELRAKIQSRTLEISRFVERSSSHMSPQLTRKLLCLFEAPPSQIDMWRSLESVLGRLLIELIQAQYSTKRREQDLIRLVDSKGCSIREPELIDQVADSLVRLYSAAIQNSETSFERNVLMKYLSKHLSIQEFRKRQVDKILQTFYWCDCFEVRKQDMAPCRLSLKEPLRSVQKMRQQIDRKIIDLGQSHGIRLPPESWAYLLYGRSSRENASVIQSILDKHPTKVTVNELMISVRATGDRLQIEKYLGPLLNIEANLTQVSGNDLSLYLESLNDLIEIMPLFTLRQYRRVL